MKSWPEKPFFEDKRRRAGLIRRVGNLAAKVDASDPHFLAMYIESTSQDINPIKQTFLKHMMACHLEFVSPLTRVGVNHLATRAGVQIELVNLRNLEDDLSNAPEIVQAAFSDTATIAKKVIGCQ
jgi:hypothetical protein